MTKKQAGTGNLVRDGCISQPWNANVRIDVMAPEENLCRRSNLVAALNDAKGHHATNYPIPPRGGIYSQRVGKPDSLRFILFVILGFTINKVS